MVATAANGSTTTPAATADIGPFSVFQVSSSWLRFNKYTSSVPTYILNTNYISIYHATFPFIKQGGLCYYTHFFYLFVFDVAIECYWVTDWGRIYYFKLQYFPVPFFEWFIFLSPSGSRFSFSPQIHLGYVTWWWWYYFVPVSDAGPSVDISCSSSGPTVYFLFLPMLLIQVV